MSCARLRPSSRNTNRSSTNSTGYSYRFIPISWKKPTHCWPIEQEYKSFFHEFDRVFLSLYPDFVEKANALLRDGEQMKTSGLNTEFRLLAVIRLGITGNSEIAQFLHISINTVYTYRNRLRNAAKCPPAEFERRIMEIV